MFKFVDDFLNSFKKSDKVFISNLKSAQEAYDQISEEISDLYKIQRFLYGSSLYTRESLLYEENLQYGKSFKALIREEITRLEKLRSEITV